MKNSIQESRKTKGASFRVGRKVERTTEEVYIYRKETKYMCLNVKTN